jgi:CheY-like chemotaxis protein
MLNHRFQVRSWPTKGTVFSIEVPLGDKSKAIKPKPEKRGWIRSKGLNGISVLVIDNEPKILEGMSALLNGWGCICQTAISSEAAVALVNSESFQPELILADYHLSETLTGIMALKELEPLLEKSVPAIVITADRTEEVKVEVEEYGAQLLTKPIRPAALRAMINKTIATSRAGDIS